MVQIYKLLILAKSAEIKGVQTFLRLTRPKRNYFLLLLLVLLFSANNLSAQSFPTNISQLPAGKKISITYKTTVNNQLNPRITKMVSDQLSLSATAFGTIQSDDPITTDPQDATKTAVFACTITNITAGAPTCSTNNQFSINITVKNDGGAPLTGNLMLEAGGQTFTAPVKAGDTLQTMLITLPANGQPIDVKAFYSDLPECALTKTALLTAPLGCGSIGNRVWEDLNGNGIQEANENGIQNVNVFLLRCTGDTLAQTTTNATGFYQFNNLAAGEYKLRFSLASAGSPFSTGVFTLKDFGIDTLDSDVDPTTKETACVTLTAGQQNTTVDAGVYVPASIGNQVWVDNNRNNIFDTGDASLANVTVRLYRCDTSTTPLAAQTTGANGLYLFSNLAPGNYKLEFGLPPTGIYERVQANVGNDATDSDAEANGFTGCYTVQSRTQNLSVDAGYTFCPPAANLACIANVNLTMNAACALQITPGMLLSSTPSCAATFEVRVGLPTGPSFGDIVTSQYVGQTLRAIVIDKQTNNFCSSNIVVNDVTKPVIVCPPNTNKAVSPQQIQLISGTLSNLNNTADVAALNCFRPLVNPSGGNHYYELYPFTVTKADVFTFELSSAFGDGAAVLFDGAVNTQSLCEGVFAQSYQSFTTGIFFTTLNPILRLTARLVPGKTYTLLTTSRLPAATGAYFWAAYSDADGLLTGVQPVTTQGAYDLICTDIDQVFNKPQSLTFVGAPLVTDNCGVPTTNITFSDELIDGGNCGGNIIIRTFTAKDAAGNSAQCNQLISIRKPTLADVIYPSLTAYLDCDASFPMDTTGNPSPIITGYPFVKTAFSNIDLKVTYCNLAAMYVDKPRVLDCSGTYTVLRDWTIADFCNPLNFLTFTQVIRVGDRKAPIVSCPTEDRDGDGVLDTLIFSTTSFNCFATFDVPAPLITDNCSSSTFSVDIISDTLRVIYDEFGFIVDTRLEKFVRATVSSTASLQISNIPIGNHTFKYTVTDACGNRMVVECPFQVKDLSEPVVVCKSSITVSLGGDGTAKVLALDINESSRDNCALDSILIRRKFTRNPQTCDTITPYWSEWGNAVNINCCDVGLTIEVEVQVRDKAGNTNECTANVEVLDKIKPFCVAPFNMTIACTALPKEFNPYDTLTLRSMFGVATATDNCGAVWQELTPIVNLSDCKFGTITRRFRTIDGVGNTSINTCQQVVTITKVNNYEIKFPKDADTQCGIPFADTLQINKLACDQLSVSVTDERFSSIGQECYRIFRTFRIINFCEYDGVSQPMVISRDEDCDNAAGDENVWVLRRPGNTFIDRNNLETDNLPAAGQRGCAPTNPRGYWRTATSVGYWQYTQVIRVFDTIPPDVFFVAPTPFCSTNDTCTAQVNIPFVINEACSTGNMVTTQITVDLNANGTSDGTLTSLGGTLSGVYPNYDIAGIFPKGKHIFEIKVQDGCGNSATKKINFEVVDCKAPTPTCASSLTVDLQPVSPVRDVNGDGAEDRGSVVVKAINFITIPVTDCSGSVRYSINRAGEVPNINRDSLIFTCAELGTPVFVEIYAWDNAVNPYAVQPGGAVGGRNYSRCEAFVMVKDDVLRACAPPKSGLISGEIRTEDGDPVESVKVSLSGQASALTRTAVNGKYSFTQLDEGYDYTIAPMFDTSHVNGVSTIDLILITKHILGVQLLDSPYKMIAADVNNSKSISTLDLIQMRKLILGIDIVFLSNTSWRFVNASYRFPVQNNPWFEQFPEVYSFNDLVGTFTNANFVAVKIGDVNLNAVTTNQAAIEPRSIESPFEFNVKEQEIRAGETYEVAFDAAISGIQGYQMTLQFDAERLELIDIIHGRTKEENFGKQLTAQGILTSSWHELKGNPLVSEEKSTRLFTLFFKAKANGKLSSLLQINSRITPAEAYNLQDEIKPVNLHFYQEESQKQPFELYQNIPNPFTDFTTIGFFLPASSSATLKILDANGKILKTVQQDFEAGYQQIEVDKRNLSPGVLYYQFETAQYFAARKMILLD